jgi:quinolinate synthase
MAMNALQNLESVLIRGDNEIVIPEDIRARAVVPIRRMLDFAREHGIGAAPAPRRP